MSDVQYNFSGKVALVTGAASGIGLATAVKFAASGASVVLGDVADEAGEAVCRTIREAGGKAHFLCTDVSRMEDCEALVASAIEKFGRLDIAFNNAGIVAKLTPAGSYDPAVWQRLLNVNLTGVFNCLISEVKVMQEQGGSIINNASILGLVGGAGGAAYNASKHGVIGLTRTAALDHGRDGIRVNAICPGFVETPMTESDQAQKAVAAAVRRTASGRLGKAEEIAHAVLWLSSNAASFVSGVALAVDGGFTAC